ncbi:MAG: hypothetical protein PHE25_05625 [Candidatus Gracilibacteria bacterium]|nr:hypothetical protein [Candidatus Gracilibacteria bacterium]
MNIEIKNQIHQIIDELIKLSEGILEEIITNKECDDSFSGNIQKIYSILEKDSFEYRKFDSWKASKYLWTPRTVPGYCKSNLKIEDLISILKEITGYNHTEDEKHFKVGEDYQIIRYLSKLLQNSKSELLIVDSYADSNLFDFFEELENNINIKVLTSEKWCKNNFKKLYFSYYGTNLEVKLNNDIHDRYIIIDQENIYLLGTSFNHMGNKDFSIKKLNDLNKITDLYDTWNKSIELTENTNG